MRFLSTPLDLSPWVQSIWSWEAGASATPEVLITPDACCEWVMHLGVPPLEWRDGAWRRQPRVFLYGQFRRALALHTDQAMRLLSVRFHPHTAAAFFGVGGGDLQAMPIEFADLCKAAAAIRWLSELLISNEAQPPTGPPLRQVSPRLFGRVYYGKTHGFEGLDAAPRVAKGRS